MGTEALLALDIGTSSCRAVLYNTVGVAIDRCSHAYQHRQGGTLDPQEILSGLQVCARTICTHQSDSKILAVGLSTLTHGLMIIDGQGQPRTALSTWEDRQATAEVEMLRSQWDVQSYRQRTGCPLALPYHPARLHQMRCSNPLLFEQARFVSIQEWLLLQLFGEPLVDYALASATGLLNLHTGQWDDTTLAQLGVEVKHLGRPVAATTKLENPRARFAGAFGLTPEVPWIVGSADGACANLGSGCAAAPRLALSLGTSGAARFILSAPVAELDNALWQYRLSASQFLIGAAFSNCGNVYQWVSERFQLNEAPTSEHSTPLSHGLTILPFWAGERSPRWQNNARAAILGMDLETTPEQVMQAALEGVSFQMREAFEPLLAALGSEPQVFVSGGGARSSVWLQLLADSLGLPLTLSRETEASARGAALLAWQTLYPQAESWPTETAGTTMPRPQLRAVYQQGYERYLQVRALLS